MSTPAWIKSNRVHRNGVYGLVGAVIHQALVDYGKLRGREREILNKLERLKRCKAKRNMEIKGLLKLAELDFVDAKEFLFTTRVEVFLRVFGCADKVNVGYLRRFAETVKDINALELNVVNEVEEEDTCPLE